MKVRYITVTLLLLLITCFGLQAQSGGKSENSTAKENKTQVAVNTKEMSAQESVKTKVAEPTTKTEYLERYGAANAYGTKVNTKARRENRLKNK